MNQAMQAVVTIHIAAPFSFNNASKGYRQATGFIVDTDLGIIMTSRHVVSEGPMQARAVFRSGAPLSKARARECPIELFHVEPIHDFAYCKFDVKALGDLPLKAIQLRPDLAKVGQEIRVLGNDMVQDMSILTGVISRVDSDPPPWDSCR